MTLVERSGELLLALKKGESPAENLNYLASMPFSELKHGLADDGLKKTFWINIYNSFIQILGGNGGLEKGKKGFFTNRNIHIAEHLWSFDDIEHGILRRGKFKYSLGYVKWPFVNSKVKQLEVEKVDFRIHFALNCGAKSCPPIAFFDPDQIDGQLDLATDAFLEQDVEMDRTQNTVYVTKLMWWYLADFGGFSGIRNLLFQKGFIDSLDYKIRFNEYDWTTDLNNYRDEHF